MVAGAGSVDFALLVVAADDGVMPQTREHLAILELLGVRHAAVALTKVDRVEESRTLVVMAQIRQLLSETPLSDAPIFRMNATRADDAGWPPCANTWSTWRKGGACAAMRVYFASPSTECLPCRDSGPLPRVPWLRDGSAWATASPSCLREPRHGCAVSTHNIATLRSAAPGSAAP